jgi:hypothetical protein
MAHDGAGKRKAVLYLKDILVALDSIRAFTAGFAIAAACALP